MLTLSVKNRTTKGKKVKSLRSEGLIPAVLYGPKIKNENLQVSLKDFEKVLNEAGESTLLSLETEGKKEKNMVLIHDIKYDPISDLPVHIDFYQPSLTEEIEVKVPVIIEGEAPAIKNLGGTLIKNISEVVVKALPQNLPKEIVVNVSGLATFEDHITIKDLKIAEDVKIARDKEDIVVYIAQPERVEEELEKPIEDKVDEVEKIGRKEKEEEA
ncbi:MAG: 50S ribosomal protein L25, partial [Candidatus Nealsonbacteria bacterium]